MSVTDKHTRKAGFTLIELLVVVAIIALLISILLPSLAQAKAMAKTVLCGSHLKADFAGYTMYGNDFNGKYPAIWLDNGGSGASTSQAPYIMWYYFLGVSLPGPAYRGGWYDPYALAYGTGFNLFTVDRYECDAYQCPELQETINDLYITPFGEKLSYSLMKPRVYNTTRNRWEWPMDWFGKADLYTHPGSTGLLTCLNGIVGEGDYNAWCNYGGKPVDPHNEKSNYLFADGHVDLMADAETDIMMWTPMWERGADY